MFFDSHAHYDDGKFSSDRLDVIAKAHEDGVDFILNVACNIATAVESIALSQEFEYVYAAVGVHPHHAAEINDNTLVTLADFASNPKVVAVGEIGLDYYYNNAPRQVQKYWFARQIEFARQLKKPIIVHDRDAHEDCMNIIRDENAKDVGGVFHCYSGSVEMAKVLLKNELYISLAGSVTFKNAKNLVEVAKYVPLDRLLIETDCPYMSPEPLRGTRNHSGNVKLIAQKIAEIRGISIDEVAEATMTNAKRLFRLE